MAALRVANELALRGIQVNSTGIRGVWSRHGLLSRHDRLLRLEKASAERTLQLSEEQVEALERFSPEFRERHIEAHYSGYLLAVDTFFVGHLKGVGKVYLQSAIDCFSRLAWGRLYTNKMPLTAVHLLNTDVLPTFEAQGISIKAALSDNGREFCGRPDRHPYELFLQLEGIEHRKTRGQAAPVERHCRTLPSHAARRALQGRRSAHLVRDRRGDAGSPRRLSGYLQHRAASPGTRHERPHALAGLPLLHSRKRQLSGGHRPPNRSI